MHKVNLLLIVLICISLFPLTSTNAQTTTMIKRLPLISFMDSPIESWNNLTHVFHPNGTFTVTDSYGNVIKVSFPMFAGIQLNYNESFVWYVFTGTGTSINAYFDFAKYADRVKITIVGTVPTVVQFAIKLIPTNKYYNSSLKRFGSVTRMNGEVKTGIFFDWSDLQGVTWAFNNSTNTLYFTISGSFVIDPSTIGTSTNSNALSYAMQRKSFYANGRFWVFYCDGSNMVCRNSTDGSTWSNAITIRGCTEGLRFSIWFDGTYFSYAYGSTQPSVGGILYRRGTPNSDGTITWSAVEQTALAGATSITISGFSLAEDSGGYPWIAYLQYNSTAGTYYPWVTKSSTNDGTWTTNSSCPYQLSSTSNANWQPLVVPLTNLRMYFICVRGLSYGKLFNGGWSSEETITASLSTGPTWCYSAVNISDDVYFAFHEDTSNDLHYFKRTYGVGWGSVGNIQLATATFAAPVLSVNTANNYIYCFWCGSTANHVYYKRFYNGVWETNPIDWITEVSLTRNDKLTCFYQAYGSYIGLAYMNNSGSPYQIRFTYLTMDASTPTLPVFRAAGAKASGSGAVTPALPTGVTIGDICVLVATTIAGGTCTITTDGGGAWTAVTGSPIDVASGEKLYVWWRRHASGDSDPTVTPASDHCVAGIAAWYNCYASNSPIETQETGTETTSDTTLSFATTISTSLYRDMIILVSSTGYDSPSAQHSAQANTYLTAIAERMDYNTNTGDGGGFECVEGAYYFTGAIGTWTATLAQSSPKAYITFALKGYVAINAVTKTVTMSLTSSLTDVRKVDSKRTITMPLTTTLSPTRITSNLRTSLLSLTSSLTNTRVVGLPRTVSLSLSSTFSVYRLEQLNRIGAMSLTSSLDPLRQTYVKRIEVFSLITSWLSSQVKTLIRSISLSLTSTFTPTRQVNYLLNPSFSSSFTFDALGVQALRRSVGLSLSSLWDAVYHITQGIQNLVRTVSMSLTQSFNTPQYVDLVYVEGEVYWNASNTQFIYNSTPQVFNKIQLTGSQFFFTVPLRPSYFTNLSYYYYNANNTIVINGTDTKNVRVAYSNTAISSIFYFYRVTNGYLSQVPYYTANNLTYVLNGITSNVATVVLRPTTLGKPAYVRIGGTNYYEGSIWTFTDGYLTIYVTISSPTQVNVLWGMQALERTVSLSLSTALDALRKEILNRVAVSSYTLSAESYKRAMKERTIGIALSSSFSSNRQVNYLVVPNMPFFIDLQPTRLEKIIRETAFSITTAWDAFYEKNIHGFTRIVEATLTSLFSPSRTESVKRSASLSMGTSWTNARIELIKRTFNMPISSTFSTETTLEFGRIVSLTLSSIWSNSRQANYRAIIINPFVMSFIVWQPTIPIVAVPYDFWLVALFLVVPIGLGLISIKWMPIIAFVCGAILIAVASFLVLNPYMTTRYFFSDGAWQTNVIAIPLHPYFEMALILLGALIIMATAVEFRNG